LVLQRNYKLQLSGIGATAELQIAAANRLKNKTSESIGATAELQIPLSGNCNKTSDSMGANSGIINSAEPGGATAGLQIPLNGEDNGIFLLKHCYEQITLTSQAENYLYLQVQ
jgi:hypothetical protein